MTVLSLGGDGVVLIRSIGFGAKMQMALAPAAERAAVLLAHCVRDEDGKQLMDAEQWDSFGNRHEDDFIALSEAAARVSSLSGDEAKKN